MAAIPPMYAPPVAQQPIGQNLPTQQGVIDPEKKRSKYKDILYRLGMTELLFGVLFIASCIASLGFAIGVTNQGYASYSYYSSFGIVYASPGIWCGIFPIISGILGICARKNTSTCMYGSNMIMAIFTAIFMGILFSISLPAAIIVTHPAIITFQILNTLGSFAILIVSIVHSAYCCAGVCCVPPTHSTRAYYTAQPVGQQYVQLANGQYMLVPNQQIPGQAYSVVGQPTAMPMPMPPQQSGFTQPGVSVPQYSSPAVQQPYAEPTKQALQPGANPPSYYSSVNYAANPSYPQ
uniref:uncharacterized protein LOC120331348 n=1 Tax=Styela clava TaxID=7725 RepID=UPI00193A5FB3|nr:uncharacterized protein LOC120331348 [Styela clava]